MATNTLTKLLRRKHLTGKEVGKLMLADLASRLEGKPLLTAQDKAVLIGNLNPSDKRIYEDYRKLYVFLLSVNMDFEATAQLLNYAHICYIRLGYLLLDAEEAYQNLATLPRIVTQKQYNRAKRIALRELSKIRYNIIRVVKNSTENGYSEILERYKSEKPSKEVLELLKQAYEEERYPAPDDLKQLSKYDIYERFLFVFENSIKLLKEGAGNLFKHEYSELVEAVLSDLSQKKGLSFLASLKEEDYERYDLITFKQAREADVFGARYEYENPVLLNNDLSPLDHGVAVLDERTTAESGYVKRDMFFYSLPWFEFRLAENFTKDPVFIDQMNDTKDSIREGYRKMAVLTYFFELVAQRTGVPELKNFIRTNPFLVEEPFKKVSKKFTDKIERYGLLEKEGDAEKLTKRARDLFSLDIKEEEYVVTDEEKKEVEKIISEPTSIDTAYGNALSYLLTGEVV